MSRMGKIARLPQLVRDELNRRLRDGETGETLLAWLNAHAGVVYVLREQFGGRPINKQNLSDWRLGGHQDWLRHQETLDWVRGLAEQDEELRDEGDGMEVSDRLAGLMAVELMRTAQTLIETVADPRERWPRLREVLQELAQLRRDDHRATRLRMDRAEANRLQDERDAQAELDWYKKQKSKALVPWEARLLYQLR